MPERKAGLKQPDAQVERKVKEGLSLLKRVTEGKESNLDGDRIRTIRIDDYITIKYVHNPYDQILEGERGSFIIEQSMYEGKDPDSLNIIFFNKKAEMSGIGNNPIDLSSFSKREVVGEALDHIVKIMRSPQLFYREINTLMTNILTTGRFAEHGPRVIEKIPEYLQRSPLF